MIDRYQLSPMHWSTTTYRKPTIARTLFPDWRLRHSCENKLSTGSLRERHSQKLQSRSRRVIGRAMQRPVSELKASGEITSAGRRPACSLATDCRKRLGNAHRRHRIPRRRLRLCSASLVSMILRLRVRLQAAQNSSIIGWPLCRINRQSKNEHGCPMKE
jgi:hypothetical protein